MKSSPVKLTEPAKIALALQIRDIVTKTTDPLNQRINEFEQKITELIEKK